MNLCCYGSYNINTQFYIINIKIHKEKREREFEMNDLSKFDRNQLEDLKFKIDLNNFDSQEIYETISLIKCLFAYNAK